MRDSLRQLAFTCFAFCPGWLLLPVSLSFTAPFLCAQSVEIRHQGRDFIDLATVGARLGMRAYWLRGHDTFRLRSRWTNIDLGDGDKLLHLNGMPVYLGFPTVRSHNRLYLAKADYRHVLQPILTPQLFRDPPGLQRIMIDPGHGGSDSGALNQAYGLKEKTLNLDVAKRLGALLVRAGYEVRYTRESDVFVPLSQRPRIANHARADLFISIHFNAATNARAAGFETFALTPQYQASSKFAKPTSRDNTRYKGNDQDPWNTLLGYHLQRGLIDGVGGPDRGLKRARFLVLKHLQCPGVLIEMGFVSHLQTAQKLRRADHRQKLAQCLFDGIRAYHQRLQRIP